MTAEELDVEKELDTEGEDDVFVDYLLSQLGQKIKDSYNETVLLRVGDVSFLNSGKFVGLENIHRNGEVLRNNNTLEIQALIEDPRVAFNWKFAFLFSRAKGSATLRMQHLPVVLKLQQTSNSTADMTLCYIPHLRGMWVEMGGAGTLNFVTGRIAAMILGVTRSRLISKIQDPVCNAIATYI